MDIRAGIGCLVHFLSLDLTGWTQALWTRVQKKFWIWSPVQLCLSHMQDTEQAMACCQCQLLISICKVPRWLRGGQGQGNWDCPLLCIAHLALGSTVLVAYCINSTREVQTAPGKNCEGFRRVQHVISHKRADSSHPPCINEVVEQKPGAFPRQQNSACDFALLPLLVLQWGFPVISYLFSTLLVFIFFHNRGAY